MATIQVTIDERAVAAVVRKLDKLADLDKSLEGPMRDALDLVYTAISPYPPPPPQSTYRRTNTLGRRWTKETRSIPNGFEGRVYNDTEYARWVQGGQSQTAVHKRTGWKTDDSVAQDKAREVQAIVDQAISKIVDGGI